VAKEKTPSLGTGVTIGGSVDDGRESEERGE